MAARQLVKYPDPGLQEPCAPVDTFDDELRRLADEMIETMRAEAGIGLAAPQVGEGVQLTVIDLSGGTDPEQLIKLVNPTVEVEEGELREEEGCLSFPDVILTVPRPARVVVKGQDIDGEPVEIEAQGLLARCLHHEIDHLNGILFLDRVSPLKRDMTRRRIAKRIRAGDW
ncbi:MAG: peptide deformylase [Acidobacteriota bacterium]|jgi:peptide deformylase